MRVDGVGVVAGPMNRRVRLRPRHEPSLRDHRVIEPFLNQRGGRIEVSMNGRLDRLGRQLRTGRIDGTEVALVDRGRFVVDWLEGRIDHLHHRPECADFAAHANLHARRELAAHPGRVEPAKADLVRAVVERCLKATTPASADDVGSDDLAADRVDLTRLQARDRAFFRFELIGARQIFEQVAQRLQAAAAQLRRRARADAGQLRDRRVEGRNM